MVYGFVGLGNIGGPMAGRLAGEAPTVVFDVDRERASRLAGVATVATDLRELAGGCGIVGICVANDSQLLDAMRRPDGLLAGLRPGSMAIVHSTVRPATVRELAGEAAARGIAVIDAAVTGGAMRAAEGKLAVMVGADPAALERARPYLRLIASDIVHAGDVGAGAALKLCNNIVAYTSALAACESFGLAEACGLGSETLYEVMSANGNLNSVMRMHLAGRAAKRSGGEAMTPDAHAQVLAEKDLDLAIEVAAEAGWDAGALRAVRALMGKVFAH